MITNLTVIGVGQKKIAPSAAYFNFKISSVGKSPQEVIVDCYKSMSALVIELENAGVPEKNITTIKISNKKINNSRRKWMMEQVSSIRVDDLTRINEIFTAFAHLGELISITKDYDKTKAIEDECQRMALKDAINKAKKYCEIAKFNTVKIKNIYDAYSTKVTPSYLTMNKHEGLVTAEIKVDFELCE